MTISVTDARAEALFASTLQASDRPTGEQIRAAITTTVRRDGGSRGCAACVAQEFGDHPDTAVARMLWAHAQVDLVFGGAR